MQFLRGQTLAMAMAMFSMFFGAGNVVYPLALGQASGTYNLYGQIGLIITGVLVPFMGLTSIMLYDADHRSYFSRIGVGVGLGVALIIALVLGPFGAIPRTITLSFSTLQMFIPALHRQIYNMSAAILIFFLAYRRRNILSILGYVLTPLLLFSLTLIIFIGLQSSEPGMVPDGNRMATFGRGIITGYSTLDLLASFLFAPVLVAGLTTVDTDSKEVRHKKTVQLLCKASLIGATLLGLVYFGFGVVASNHTVTLEGVRPESLLATLAVTTLGSYGGIIASAAVALACLTTAISLAAAFADFMTKNIFMNNVNYRWVLAVTMVVTFFVANMGFRGISSFLTPILVLCYPAIITFAFLNLLHKLTGFKPVKVPVLIVFILTTIWSLI